MTLSIDEFLNALKDAQAIAILRTPTPGKAGPAMEAAVRGGFRVIEFTLNTPGALELIEEFSVKPNLLVGAGTVLTEEEAEEAIARGASFLVSPVFDETVLAVALRHGIPMIPGTVTPMEMLAAHRAGAPLVKLFPAPENGPDYVRACLGPLPFLRIVPTSGVSRENAATYLDAGAFAVGFVKPLFDPQAVNDGRTGVIENRARALLAALHHRG